MDQPDSGGDTIPRKQHDAVVEALTEKLRKVEQERDDLRDKLRGQPTDFLGPKAC